MQRYIGALPAVHAFCGTTEGVQGLLICLVTAVLALACSFADWTDPRLTDMVRHAVLEHFSLLHSQGIASEQAKAVCACRPASAQLLRQRGIIAHLRILLL